MQATEIVSEIDSNISDITSTQQVRSEIEDKSEIHEENPEFEMLMQEGNIVHTLDNNSIDNKSPESKDESAENRNGRGLIDQDQPSIIDGNISNPTDNVEQIVDKNHDQQENGDLETDTSEIVIYENLTIDEAINFLEEHNIV